MNITHFIEDYRLRAKPMRSIDIVNELHGVRKLLGFEEFKNGKCTGWVEIFKRGNSYIWEGDAMTPNYYTNGV